MRNGIIRAALTLACVILVATTGIGIASADFASIFTAFQAPTLSESHAEAPGLQTSGFLWKAMDMIPGNNDTSVNTIQSMTNSDPEVTGPSLPQRSTTSWMSGFLTTDVTNSYNPGRASYDNFVTRYMNSSSNIFD
jgi:hypothetical protein